jgi:hypothetical protein
MSKTGRVLAASALSLALIHQSAWNRFSANFAFWGFCELRLYAVLRSSRVWTDSVGSLSKEEQHRAYPQQVDKCEGEAHQEEDRL